MSKHPLVDKYFPVHDYGFVALKDFMGGDDAVVQAARVSYGKGTKKKSDDEGLIRYLMRHSHTTPFEMCEVKIHIRIEMDTWRQMIRSRTASVNEYSTRYSEAIDLMHKTDPAKWRTQSKNNKQGSGDCIADVRDCPSLPHDFTDGNFASPGEFLSQAEEDFHCHARYVYEQRLQMGVAREQARKDLPLATYTEAYWKMDLHNLMHFLRLRLDSHAQIEIRNYATVIAGIVKELFPITFQAFLDYKVNAVPFSAGERNILLDLIPAKVDLHDVLMGGYQKYGLSAREIDEFFNKLKAPNSQDYTLDLSKAKDPEFFQLNKG